MNRDEIIRMAREAGWLTWKDAPSAAEFIERFFQAAYAAGAAAEREAILDLVDAYAKNNTDLADAIRARGQA